MIVRVAGLKGLKMSNKCPKCGSEYFGIREDDTCLSCGWHRVTVFDRITLSPEVLAEKLVFWMSCHKANGSVEWVAVSTIIEGKWGTREEAIAATVAKLKEVAEDD